MVNQRQELRYSCTNEDLRGIVAGLDFSPKDSVLAVAGSGDQAFAFLEFARQVKAVDIVPQQIKLMQQRAEALRSGDYDEFLEIDLIGSDDGYLNGTDIPEFNEANRTRRRKYFTADPQRLERIRKNLNSLIIAEPIDILEVAQLESGFSKIYLSNALSHRDLEGMIRPLRNIAVNLPSEGLIYVANHDELSNRLDGFVFSPKEKERNNLKNLSFWDRNEDLTENSFLPLELEIDRNLSIKARKYERGMWKPAVYRRVEAER